MKALVVCRNTPLSQSPGATWAAMSPLIDRPFLHHVVETIVGQEIREIEFVFGQKDRFISGVLGNGTRWGASFRYHLLPPGANLYDSIKQMKWQNPEELVLLAHSDRLPSLQLETAPSATTLFCWEEEERFWTGWALIRPATLHGLPNGMDEPGLLAFLMKAVNDVVCQPGECPLTARSYEELLEANRRVLAGGFPGLLHGGREVEPGVWMARNARVHRTAKVVSPAFLGENCRIGAMAQVGPGASIGRDCIIERETQVADSVVCSGSYVGRQLALRGVVVDQSRFFSTFCDVEIDGVDELLLGCIFGKSFRGRVRRACSRIGATAAFLVFGPFFVGMLLGARMGLVPPARKRLIVLTPTVAESYRWKTFELWSFGQQDAPVDSQDWLRHFLFIFLPALLAIADGYMSFGGPRARTEEEVEHLPASRRSAYLRMRCGILQPQHVSSQTDQDLDAFEISGTGWRETLNLMKRYAGRILRSLLPRSGNLIGRSAAQ
jgi:hypothetical protein